MRLIDLHSLAWGHTPLLGNCETGIAELTDITFWSMIPSFEAATFPGSPGKIMPVSIRLHC